jgi:hypothetical protein
MEERPNVRSTSSLISNSHRRLDQRAIREGTQEHDRIEEIRLSNRVPTRDTGERPEGDVHVEQILEASDLQPSQHRNSIVTGYGKSMSEDASARIADSPRQQVHQQATTLPAPSGR